jgi:hypothetical protein
MRWFWQTTYPNWGFMLLGIWLILTGLFPLLGFSAAYSSTILAILAVAAGALIVMRR